MKKDGPKGKKSRAAAAANAAKVANTKAFVEGKESLGSLNARLNGKSELDGKCRACNEPLSEHKPSEAGFICPQDLPDRLAWELRKLGPKIAGDLILAVDTMISASASEERRRQGAILFRAKDRIDTDIEELRRRIHELQVDKGRIAKEVHERLGKGPWRWGGGVFHIVQRKAGQEGKEGLFFFRGESEKIPGVLG
jgi:hypothetical protein